MKYESWNIAVEGQKTGEAVLHGYLLDAISVAPEKMLCLFAVYIPVLLIGDTVQAAVMQEDLTGKRSR